MNPPLATNAAGISLHNSHVTSSRDTNLTITNQFLAKFTDPYEILEKYTNLGALYDSDARYDPPKCHPETRVAVLHHIRNWAMNTNTPPLLWIRGGAGAGKSAIAQTLSEEWDEDHSLAASFFFSRTASGRNEKKYLIPTLAYQIFVSIPASQPFIREAVQRAPRIFDRNLRSQMKQLIINPLVSLAQSALTKAKVVIIDGLDECCIDYVDQDHEQQQKEILECIHLAASQDGFPLRFLLASRPERQIRELFELGQLKPVSSCITLDNRHNPAADIELYLRCKLEEIKLRHPHLGPSWPSEDIIAHLVRKSSGHFIYAAVAVRYLSSPRMDPQAGLEAIMRINPCADIANPFVELDALYTHILRSVAGQTLPAVMQIFVLMIFGDAPGGVGINMPMNFNLFGGNIRRMSPAFIAKYFFIPIEELYLYLIDLYSILDIPTQQASCTTPITFLHASFSEYLTQPARSQEFYIDGMQASLHLLSLRLMHLYIQVLSPDSGREHDYTSHGFAFETSYALRRIPPDAGFLEGLRALVDQDEAKFAEQVQRINLANLGTKRRSLEVIDSLYRGARFPAEIVNNQFGLESAEGFTRPTVLVVLKKHFTEGFLPIDPDSSGCALHAETLEWFCNTQQGTSTTHGSS